VSFQSRCSGHDIACFKVEMKVIAVFHKFDGRIFLVCEFQMKELTARTDTRVEILILEFKRQSHFRGVEADRFSQIGGPQLRNYTRYLHCLKAASQSAVPPAPQTIYAFPIA